MAWRCWFRRWAPVEAYAATSMDWSFLPMTMTHSSLACGGWPGMRSFGEPSDRLPVNAPRNSAGSALASDLPPSSGRERLTSIRRLLQPRHAQSRCRATECRWAHRRPDDSMKLAVLDVRDVAETQLCCGC